VIDTVSLPELPPGSLLSPFVTFVNFCSSPLCTDHRLYSPVSAVTPSEFAHFASASLSARDGQRRAMQLIRRHSIKRFDQVLDRQPEDCIVAGPHGGAENGT
jgi:hypothetical protein